VVVNFIVDKTEKYSTMLAESLNQVNAQPESTPAVSDEESRSSGGKDEEYQPDMSSDDDEETITKEDDGHEEGELDMLKQEANISVEELLRKFHPELYGDDEDEVKKEKGPEDVPKEAATVQGDSEGEGDEEDGVEEADDEDEEDEDEEEDNSGSTGDNDSEGFPFHVVFSAIFKDNNVYVRHTF
jgi:hypothetical protein